MRQSSDDSATMKYLDPLNRLRFDDDRTDGVAKRRQLTVRRGTTVEPVVFFSSYSQVNASISH